MLVGANDVLALLSSEVRRVFRRWKRLPRDPSPDWYRECMMRIVQVRFLPFYRDAFRLLVLRWSLDRIARRNGWHFHTDGVHLNSRSGTMLANLVQEFLDGHAVAVSRRTGSHELDQ